MQPGGLCIFGGGDMSIKLTATFFIWNPTTVLPDVGKFVVYESYYGTLIPLYIDKPIDEWGDTVAKWAYLPIEETKEEDTHDNEIERQLDEIKDAVHRLECNFRVNDVHMDRANNKLKSYLNEQYEKHTDECGSGSSYVKIKTSRDDTPESSVSGPEGEVSVDDLRDKLCKVLRRLKDEGKEKELAEYLMGIKEEILERERQKFRENE